MEARTIGQLAHEAGVGVETIRYYERRGLLREPPRTPSGYRQYDASDLWRLRYIARAKHLGFTLSEVAGLLGADGDATTEAVVATARRRLEALAAQQVALAETRARLERLLDVCQRRDGTDCRSLTVSR